MPGTPSCCQLLLRMESLLYKGDVPVEPGSKWRRPFRDPLSKDLAEVTSLPLLPWTLRPYPPFPWMHSQERRWPDTHVESSSRWRSEWVGCWGSPGPPRLHGGRRPGSESGCGRACSRAPRPGRWAGGRPSSSGSPPRPAAARWRGAGAGERPPLRHRTPHDRRTATSSGRKHLLIPGGTQWQEGVRTTMATAPGPTLTWRGLPMPAHPPSCLSSACKGAKTWQRYSWKGSHTRHCYHHQPRDEQSLPLHLQVVTHMTPLLSGSKVPVYFNLICSCLRWNAIQTEVGSEVQL